MATKIDVLGTTTTASVADTTVYTVPGSKVARVRIMFSYEGGGNDYNAKIYIGDAVATLDEVVEDNPGANKDIVSGIAKAADMNLTAPSILTGTAVLSSGKLRGLMMPVPFDYFLVAGDLVVSSVVGNAISTVGVKVFGVEDDA